MGHYPASPTLSEPRVGLIKVCFPTCASRWMSVLEGKSFHFAARPKLCQQTAPGAGTLLPQYMNGSEPIYGTVFTWKCSGSLVCEEEVGVRWSVWGWGDIGCELSDPGSWRVFTAPHTLGSTLPAANVEHRDASALRAIELLGNKSDTIRCTHGTF